MSLDSALHPIPKDRTPADLALDKIYYSPCLYIYPIYSVVKHHPRLLRSLAPPLAAMNISSSPCARVKPLVCSMFKVGFYYDLQHRTASSSASNPNEKPRTKNGFKGVEL